MESRSFLFAIAILSLPVALHSEQAQQQKPEERTSIQGYVIKIGSAEPVSKALVTLTRSDGWSATYSAMTDAEGQFFFQNPKPGQYRLSAARNGYVSSEYGARAPNRPGLPITLTAGQKMTGVVVQMLPAGTIAGRVFNRDGEPLPDVEVQALKYSYQEGQRLLINVQTARTNDLGEYRLFWLQPGQYVVSATYKGGPEGERALAEAIVQASLAKATGGRVGAATPGNVGQPEERYIPVYYPGVTDAQAAAPIHVPSGTVLSGVDFTVTAVRTLSVRGHVINGANGQPIRNATLMLVTRGRTGLGNSLLQDPGGWTIDDQGAFEIRGVVPGSYDLVAQTNDPNNRLGAVAPVEVGNSDVQNVALVVSPGFSLAGRLTIEGRNAGSNGQSFSRMRVSLLATARALQLAGMQPSSSVQADGTFVLPQVRQSDYRVNIAGLPRNMYLKAVQLGGADILNEGLHLEREPGRRLEIVIGTDTGAVDGTVVDERQQPSANVTVALVPGPAHRHRSDLYRTVSTDALGRFHMEGMPAGDYKLFAREDVEPGAWEDPDFIRQFENHGKSVRINEGGTSITELRVIY